MQKPSALIDHNALKANQAAIIALALLAYILDLPLIALATALIMLLGALAGKPGFLPIYAYVLKPMGILKPDLVEDNKAPHRFAQGFGGLVLLGGALSILAGTPLVGWPLVWLVIFLAALNAFAGFCAGCFLYYQLARLGLPGFSQSPLEGSRPGFKAGKRPLKEDSHAV